MESSTQFPVPSVERSTCYKVFVEKNISQCICFHSHFKIIYFAQIFPKIHPSSSLCCVFPLPYSRCFSLVDSMVLSTPQTLLSSNVIMLDCLSFRTVCQSVSQFFCLPAVLLPGCMAASRLFLSLSV